MATIKRFTFFIMVLAFGACSNNASNKNEEVRYQSNWESLKQHETPDWFLDAKFGIYCHWGPYSVPAYETEWYSHYMYVKGHPIRKYHEETYGPLNEFGYKDFIPMFTAEKFDADEWADLFQQAGAQFAGPVTEHADGFAMWDSKLTQWNAMDMGPKRDVVGELSKAIKARGMKFIATFHHQWNFGWYATWDETTDAANPEYEQLYGPKLPGPEAFEFPNSSEIKFFPDKKFVDFWYDKIIEVINTYEPDLIYFDNKLNIIPEQKRMDFLSYYYNYANKAKQDVVCTYKFEEMAQGAAVLDLERSRMAEKKEFPWLTDDSIDWGSWCHVSNPDYKSTNRLIDFLIDVVSKNGAVLLNVTPTAEGVIPQEVKDRLLEMGSWLKMNGEAIYGTRTWKVFGEGPAEVIEGHLSERDNADNTAKDIRFTTKGDYLYALVLDIPQEDIVIKSLGRNAGLLDKKIKSVKLLGSSEELVWEASDDFVKIEVPQNMPCDHAIVFRFSF